MKMTVALALACVTVGLSLAQESDAAVKQYDLNIPRQTLDTALKDLAQQTGLQIARFTDNGHGSAMVGPVQGAVTAETALDALLAPTGLIYRVVNDRTIAVMAPGSGTPVAAAGSAEGEGGSDPGKTRTKARTVGAGRTTQNQTRAQNQASQPSEHKRESDREKRPIEEIIVTGTNIRGIAPESSPVRVFDREEIQISGAGTAQDFIQTLTTNFQGGASERFTAAPGNQQAGLNTSEGAGVNLRGLGSGSTLVLLNGRRLAASSDIGGFTDISMIPASAIERVEVLTDGASSIYGADAVAGVVNFVLRDDYEGAETSVRYGLGTEGGEPEEYRVNTTVGANWDSGNGLVVYEYYKRDNLDASDRDFAKGFLLPNDLLPRQERHSAMGSLSQELTPSLKVGADVLFSRRNTKRTITHLIGSGLGLMSVKDISTDNLNIAANLTWNFAHDWYLDIAGNYSEIETGFDDFRTDGSEIFRDNDADYWAVDAIASGTVFDVPAGPVKLAIGGHYREESFLNVLDNTTTRRRGDRKVHAVFGEAFIPIIGPDNALPGVRRLEVNASGRFEDYSDFGSEANPKIGLIWAPIEQLRLRGSYGTSFKPPTVGQTGALDRGATALPTTFVFDVFGIEPADPSIADVVLLTPFGTSDDLDAETSRAFTGGLDYDAASGPHRISFSSTYFDIKFKNRLGDTPVPDNQDVFAVFNIAFESPELFPTGTVVFFPTQNELDAVFDSLNTPAVGVFGADPADTAIISFASITRNLSLTEVRGVDFDATYSFDGDFGTITLGIDGTYIDDFTQQAAVTTPVVELLDTQFNPLDLNLRGRVGYARDGFNANVFVNYADDYRVDNTDTAAKMNSWTTVDLSLSYDAKERFESPLTVFRLSVVNLFDKDPPAAPAVLDNRLLGFDPTNASPLGRFIAFELTKRF